MKTRAQAIEHAMEEIKKLVYAIKAIRKYVPDLPECDVFIWHGIVQITVANQKDLKTAARKLEKAGWTPTGNTTFVNNKAYYSYNHKEIHRDAWPYPLELAIEVKEIDVGQLITNRELVLEG